MKIWLIGMMGSGKTTAGEIAASNLGVPFFDLDRLIEQRLGEPIGRYWADHGEKAFREVESAVVADLERDEGIFATGGGVVLDAGNRAVLSRSGLVVWLDATPATLATRVTDSHGRPLLAGREDDTESALETTLDDRVALYTRMADHRVGTDDLTPIEVARRLETLWKS